MRLMGLEPMTYGLKVVPSSAAEAVLKPAAAMGCDNGPVGGEAGAQRKAQHFGAETAPAEATSDPDLALLTAAWPTLRADVKASILTIVQRANMEATDGRSAGSSGP